MTVLHVLLSLPIAHSNDACLILERNLPKLANKLKTFALSNVLIDHSCVSGIAHLLNTSLKNLTLKNYRISSTDFDSLTAAIATSELKKLEITPDIINPVRGQSLAKLLTQSKTLEEVTVVMGSEYTNNCNVARLLVEAMTHSSVKNLKLRLKTYHYCDVSDIHYDRDRVEVLPQHWMYI